MQNNLTGCVANGKYEIVELPESKQESKTDSNPLPLTGIDYFMATHNEQNAINWITFCKEVLKKEITDEPHSRHLPPISLT